MYTIDGVILYKDLYKDLPVSLREDILNILHSAHQSVFFQLGFTPCKAEQSLQGMELQEKEAEKD